MSGKPILYHFYKTRSSKVLWLIKELNIDVEVRPVDLTPAKREQRLPEYLKLNPSGTVPTLVDGDLVLTESLAICLYLLDKYDRNHALGGAPGTQLRSLVYDIGAWTSAEVEEPVVEWFLHGCLWEPPRKDPEIAARAKKEWTEHLKEVCAVKLGDKPYILGDTFTAADVFFGYSMQLAQRGGLLAQVPKLDEYAKRVSSREGFGTSHNPPQQ